ncbi:hypothetical protein RJ639_007969 [Escallonia herrerae]|uniref:Uncharacterized protein n=1 Tax=Escallonia herrerae TaxID=1293975 RepID=A0AA88VVQ4_9ASTE|nr:hypothetical protein RJ639_007969 [Escallonia herrerae]
MEVKTSLPTNIKAVKTTSWASEKTSISTVDMLETVVADTDVKNKSKSLVSKLLLCSKDEGEKSNDYQEPTSRTTTGGENGIVEQSQVPSVPFLGNEFGRSALCDTQNNKQPIASGDKTGMDEAP